MRYLILSDIHANLPALEAVVGDVNLEEMGEILCLGDMVGYGPHPNECIARVQEISAKCVAGNHDWAAIGRMNSADFNPAARMACEWTAKELTSKNASFLEKLPTTLTQDDYTLVHGSLRAPIWEYITHPTIAKETLELMETRYCFHGHTHVPVIFYSRDKDALPEAFLFPPGQEITLGLGLALVNVGSVGQPRDGDPRASYLIFDDEKGTLEYRRVDYPIEETQEGMRRVGMPDSLIIRLSYGW